MKKVYLDHAATTAAAPEVVAAMTPFFSDIYGNPSSIHAFGWEAKQAIEEAREHISMLLGCSPEELIFTSGGTESNNTLIKGIALTGKDKGRHIITTNIEHHAVLEPCRFLEKNGFRVTAVPVGSDGLINPEDIRSAITDDTILISVMHANNEIGVIQPIAEIGELARSRGICFHTDAVQTFGHIPVNVNDLKVDALSISAHKLYGPKGVGALYLRKGTRMTPLLHGGDQERGRRASTYNLPGIVGFGKSAALAKDRMTEEEQKTTRLRDKLIAGVLSHVPHSRLNGHPVCRLPNNAHFAIPYVEGEAMLLRLDMEGIACSTGSACTSSSLEPSHVLIAIGLPHEIAHGSLRFTLGRQTTEEEIDYVIGVLPPVVERLRAMSPLYQKENGHGRV